MSSIFNDVEPCPPVAVFQLTADYKASTGPNKVNLGVGAYQTNEGKPYVLEVVSEAERRIAQDFTLNHEYLPMDGLASFTEACTAVVFGKEHPIVVNKKYVAIQGLGGTGALRVCTEFLSRKLGKTVAYVSNPTWPNHVTVCKFGGISEVKQYRYWDAQNKKVDFDGMMEDLGSVAKGGVVILHSVAHNPTGMDLNKDQWNQVFDTLIAREAVIVMDTAYQGFASGDLDVDAQSVRMLAERGVEFFVAQSMSKNFGLYNERVGNLVVVVNNPDKVEAVRSQLKVLVRYMYSNPPTQGARIVSTVLNDETLNQQWRNELQQMADRIKAMRQLLYEKLKVHEIDWPHVIQQTGMFSYTGLTPEQVKFLRDNYDVFVMKDGRVNMCAFTTDNAQYIADAFAHAVKTVQ